MLMLMFIDNETATIKYKYSILYPPHPCSAPGAVSSPVRLSLDTRSILLGISLRNISKPNLQRNIRVRDRILILQSHQFSVGLSDSALTRTVLQYIIEFWLRLRSSPLGLKIDSWGWLLGSSLTLEGSKSDGWLVRVVVLVHHIHYYL